MLPLSSCNAATMHTVVAGGQQQSYRGHKEAVQNSNSVSFRSTDPKGSTKRECCESIGETSAEWSARGEQGCSWRLEHLCRPLSFHSICKY